jgi:hypothetical protein
VYAKAPDNPIIFANDSFLSHGTSPGRGARPELQLPDGARRGPRGADSEALAQLEAKPRATLALGIAFNELATNAVKYGASSDDTGSILIAWTIESASKEKPSDPALAGEGRPAGRTTVPQRTWLAGD